MKNGSRSPNGPPDEIADIEYLIRRSQRGLAILLRDKDIVTRKTDHQTANLEASVRHHTEEIISLKKRLRDLTGRSTPRTPKWPI